MSVAKIFNASIARTHQIRGYIELVLSNFRQLRHGEPRITQRDVLFWLITAIVECPCRHLKLCESNLHPNAVVGDVRGYLASGGDKLVGRLFPVTYIDSENHVCFFQRLMIQ